MSPVINADTHVDETEDTWEYIQPGDEEYKPYTGYPSNPDPNRPPFVRKMTQTTRASSMRCSATG